MTMETLRRISESPVASPTPTEERLVVLDVLRGFAIFGILIVNMKGYASPGYYLENASLDLWPSRLDHVVERLLQVFAQGKMVALFSFLFGLGFSLNLWRAMARGDDSTVRSVRRLLVLLSIGIVHSLFVWGGDILTLYGVLGFLLLLASRLPTRIILALSLLFFLFPSVRWEAHILRNLDGDRGAAAGQASLSPGQTQAEARLEVDRSFHAYAHGSYKEIFVQRLRDDNFYWHHSQAVPVFSLFLFGFYVGRRRFLEEVSARKRKYEKLWWLALVTSTAGTIGLYFLYLPNADPLTFPLRPIANVASQAGLMALYPVTLILLCQRQTGARLLKPLAAVGRTALTNYLLQSLICTTVFYHYGLGFYGKVGPASGVILAIGIFSPQVFLSNWWIRRFRYGPFEWFWRCLTYWKIQPMQVGTDAPKV